MAEYKNPFIEERADPFVTRGEDGTYYFTASYPAVGDELHGYDRIILRKRVSCCVFCGAENDLVVFKGKKVCKLCLEEIAK